jgi:hypothetical protein
MIPANWAADGCAIGLHEVKPEGPFQPPGPHSWGQIIYVVASGYGSKGEDAEKRAFDVLVQARSGVMMSCGDRDSSEPYEIAGGCS